VQTTGATSSYSGPDMTPARASVSRTLRTCQVVSSSAPSISAIQASARHPFFAIDLRAILTVFALAEHHMQQIVVIVPRRPERAQGECLP
jgi:hypothetical protein